MEIRSRRSAAGFAILLCLAATSSLGAQSCPLATEELRFELAGFTADLETLADDLEERGAPIATSLRGMIDHLVTELDPGGAAEWSPRESEQLCAILTRYPELREAPRLLTAALPSAPTLEGKGVGCQSMPSDIYLALFIANEVLKGIEVVGQAICDAAACPVYVGAVVCAPAPPECSLVCPLSLGVVQFLVLISESVLANDDNCSELTHYDQVATLAGQTTNSLAAIDDTVRQQVAPYLDAAVSSLASQQAADGLRVAAEAGLGDLDGRLALISDQLEQQGQAAAGFQAITLRLRVEAILQVGPEGPISSLLLPESLGGELEAVREIVADSIQMNLAADQPVGQALALFAAADGELNLQRYREAFHLYRRSYQEAAAPQKGATP